MRKVCFTAVDDNWYYPVGTHIMVNSFRKFHPDIDLIVFREDVVKPLFKEKGINWFQAKPFLAELLEDKYDLIVNMDGDHIVLDRMSEVFDNVDYDVALPTNLNDYENASFENITEEMYLQCGLVASTSKKFWKKWRERNKDAMKYIRKENDIVNLVIYNEMKDLKLKILDKKKDYYGCKSLGREPQFYIKDGKTYCMRDSGQVIAYHYARGGGAMPKLDIRNMPLMQDVKKRWLEIASQGTTTKMINI